MEKSEKRKVYRQGDIVIRETTKVPSYALRRQSNVVAEGELSGHRHELLSGEQVLYEDGDSLYVISGSPLFLAHPEHGQLSIPAGTYEILKEREFNPFVHRTAEVAD